MIAKMIEALFTQTMLYFMATSLAISLPDVSIINFICTVFLKYFKVALFFYQ